MRASLRLLPAVILAACAAPESPAAPAAPGTGGWAARIGAGTCLLEAATAAGKVQMVARPATVAFAMGRMDGAGPRLDPARTATMIFEGPGAGWSIAGLPVAPRSFGFSRPRPEGGLDILRATLPGGTFRAPELDLAIPIPPAGEVGEAFLRCVEALTDKPLTAPAEAGPKAR
ncbi:hypothetical protein G3576_04980 [Roseomonas stagni]|uniref:Lipoprotein n=1 Tax=Falsiroseomonas algicola TaxID=2716930 RepID=A0A6M1LG49_9PROT|nr:hypothetical protein [Falsiroseomonas algicola]NGM19358.1 hypothetical protein [Falsiroseomonas algicola]